MKWLSYTLARLLGWRFLGVLPPVPKMVVVGAPHTSNWDFVLFLAALHAYRIRARFLGKHTLFRRPFGLVFRAWGGIPVDRSRPGGVVRQVADVFERCDELILVIAPEGTRAATPFWKSGFLKIAEAAGVPIVFASIDALARAVTLSEAVTHEGDPAEVMEAARAFYAGKMGVRPEGGGPIRVEEEA
ncbi:MAG: 1-acyl-sn-glycerol-3-phosphate acyltransferase [Actinobacteria bacterium]|nr:1-acyl-sn-glycerol-3-phosphate acyltransferase [Actinomycetota bacterium]